MKNRQIIALALLALAVIGGLLVAFLPSFLGPFYGLPEPATDYERIARELEQRNYKKWNLDVLDIYRLCADGSTPTACPKGMDTAISIAYTASSSDSPTREEIEVLVVDMMNSIWRLRVKSDFNVLLNRVYNNEPRIYSWIYCFTEYMPIRASDLPSADKCYGQTDNPEDPRGISIGNHMRWEGIGVP